MWGKWGKASAGWALGLVLGGGSVVWADLPRLAEDLQTQSAVAPLEAALDDEVFHAPSRPAGPVIEYCPPRRFGLPPMIGDFFPGYAGGVLETTEIDRLLVVADDLDVPGSLSPNQRLIITEPGPLGIFRTSITTVQQLQQLLRAGQMLPPAMQVGTINADATLTSALTVAQIETLLASTPGVGFDVIPLAAPPGTYLTAVDAVFSAATPGGVTRFDPASSGAFLQGGADTLAGQDLDAFYFYTYALEVNVPTPSAGTAGVGRSRISENGTVTPQDRIFFDYGFFSRVGFVAGSSEVHRFTPGFEKTFLDGMASLELRLPFASTVGELIFESGATNTDEIQLGNLAVYLKALLYEQNGLGLSGGLGVIFPTAESFDVVFTGGPLIDIDNDAYHLQPFLGGYYAPGDRFFSQAFVQLDFDVNGNPVAVGPGGAGLRNVGRLQDSVFLFLDWAVGYWLIRGEQAPVLPVSSFHEDGRITQRYHSLGFAPTLELHYARSLDDADVINTGNLRIGNFSDDVETLTLILGAHLEIGENTNVGLGYATALTGGDDEPFDGAFRLTLNQFFGRK